MRIPFLSSLLLLLGSLVGSVGAQTTHQVRLTGIAFTPSDLVICTGDRVQWVWDVGRHNVESGVAGVNSGHFRSGPLETASGQSYFVTFDAAFLAAHPEPGNVYDYFCSAHFGLGMTGEITVQPAASVTPRNGSGVNPLTLSSSRLPVLGQGWQALLDCSAHAPARGALFGYAAANPQPVPLSIGELLVDSGAARVFFLVSPHAGDTIPFDFQLPAQAALCGTTLYAQGACLGAPGARLSNALDVTAGF